MCRTLHLKRCQTRTIVNVFVLYVSACKQVEDAKSEAITNPAYIDAILRSAGRDFCMQRQQQ